MTAPAEPTAPPRTRRGVLVVAVLIVLFVIVNGAVQLTSQILHTHFSESSTIVPLAPQLTVKGHEGNVMVTPSPDGKVHVTTSGKYGAARPELIADSTDSGLVLDSRCGDVTFVTCRIDYVIQVPPAFAVRLQGGATDVAVRNLTGTLDIDLESGSADVSNTSGAMRLHTGSGFITGNQLRSTTVTATTTDGGVYLDMLVAPQSLTVDSGFGDVSITVPGTEVYKIAAETATGRKRVDVAQAATSSRSITARAESGDIRIRPRGQLDMPSPPDAPGVLPPPR